MSQARDRGLSIAQRIYQALRDHQPAPPRVLASLVGVDVVSARNAIKRLTDLGLVTHSGAPGWRSVCVLKKGARMPEDLRGTHPSSSRALAAHRFVPGPPRIDVDRLPKPGVELERAWPVCVVSSD